MWQCNKMGKPIYLTRCDRFGFELSHTFDDEKRAEPWLFPSS